QVAPVEADAEWQRVSFWDAPAAGFAMTPAAKIARNTGYPARFSRAHLLAHDATLCTIDASARIGSAIRAEACVRAVRGGMLHGIGGWFLADLADGITMSNGPLAERRIDRSNVFFPLDRPIA